MTGTRPPATREAFNAWLDAEFDGIRLTDAEVNAMQAAFNAGASLPSAGGVASLDDLETALNIGLAALGHFNTEQTDQHWNKQESELRGIEKKLRALKNAAPQVVHDGAGTDTSPSPASTVEPVPPAVAAPIAPPTTEGTLEETSGERRLRHRLEKIDAVLDQLGAPKSDDWDGLNVSLSQVGRILRLVGKRRDENGALVALSTVARSESGESFLGENDYREALLYAQMTMRDLAAGKPVRDLDEQLSWIEHLLDGKRAPSSKECTPKDVEDIIDGLRVIARRRGEKVTQGDVLMIDLAITALLARSARGGK